MNETVVCVVGNVATAPVYRELPSGTSARFRLAVTARFWDRERNVWTDGHTNFFTVWANRQLAGNVMASVEVGQPVVVQGRLKVRMETGAGQQQWASADIDAVTIGHDLARGTAAFRRTPRPEAPPSVTPRAETRQADTGPEPAWETPPPQAAPEAETPAVAEAPTRAAVKADVKANAMTEVKPDGKAPAKADGKAPAKARNSRPRREPALVT
ncbi:single-stranded DNA-binding protein [Streptomyces sp. NPDC005573]|uniref:single-stranded DNA-binding protein n=1 Tax=Streptomyces sp. NPDC005573 TaxID=3156890 RepID=UPI0033B5F244